MIFKMNIEKTTTIGEILEKAPEKADLLLEAGMHCLGCPASQMETLEEACEVHGIDVNELVEKLNKYLSLTYYHIAYLISLYSSTFLFKIITTNATIAITTIIKLLLPA